MENNVSLPYLVKSTMKTNLLKKKRTIICVHLVPNLANKSVLATTLGQNKEQNQEIQWLMN